ncbi:SEFIR domain-containing protein [Nonomuraea sp. NPDC004186]
MTEAQAEAWETQVRALAEILRDPGGIDVRFDKFQPPGTDFTRWGPNMVDECRFVVIVASRAYKERWEGKNRTDEGAGAAREIDTIRSHYNRDQHTFNYKFVLAVLVGVTDEDVSNEIYARLDRFYLNPQDYRTVEKLVKRLWDHHDYPVVPIGPRPTFEKKPLATAALKDVFPLPSANAVHEKATHAAALVDSLHDPPPPPRDLPELEAWRWTASEWIDAVVEAVAAIEELATVTHTRPRPSFLRDAGALRSALDAAMQWADQVREPQAADEAVAWADLREELQKLLARALTR